MQAYYENLSVISGIKFGNMPSKCQNLNNTNCIVQWRLFTLAECWPASGLVPILGEPDIKKQKLFLKATKQV
jgi:hypothetical protein